MIVMRDGQVTSHTLLESVSWLASTPDPTPSPGSSTPVTSARPRPGNEEIVTSDGSAVSDGATRFAR